MCLPRGPHNPMKWVSCFLLFRGGGWALERGLCWHKGKRGRGSREGICPSKAFADYQKDATWKSLVLRGLFPPHQEGCSQPLHLRPHHYLDALRDSLVEH